MVPNLPGSGFVRRPNQAPCIERRTIRGVPSHRWDRAVSIGTVGSSKAGFTDLASGHPLHAPASGRDHQTAPDLPPVLDEGNVLAPRRGALLIHDDFLGILGQEAAPDVFGDVGARPVKRAA